MATRYYFHATNAVDGPTAEASTDTDSTVGSPADKGTPKDMSKTAGAGQTSVAGVYNTAATPLYHHMRIFVGPPLQAGQAITVGQTITVALATQESSTSMNLRARTFAYIWRSGSGNVKTLLGPQSCDADLEHGTGEVECTMSGAVPAGAFSTLLNDRVVCETWADTRNTKSTNYTATHYYDGTDVTFVDGTVTADAGSYIDIGTDTLLAVGEGGQVTMKRPMSKTVRHNRRSGTTQYVRLPSAPL